MIAGHFGPADRRPPAAPRLRGPTIAAARLDCLCYPAQGLPFKAGEKPPGHTGVAEAADAHAQTGPSPALPPRYGLREVLKPPSLHQEAGSAQDGWSGAGDLEPLLAD